MGCTNAWGFHLETKFRDYAQRAPAINFQKRCSRVTHWNNCGRKRNTFGAIKGRVEQIWRAEASIWWLSVGVREARIAESIATYEFSFDKTNRRGPKQCWRGNACRNQRVRGGEGRGQVSWVCTHYATYQAQLRIFQCHEHAFRPIDGRAQGENEASWGLS